MSLSSIIIHLIFPNHVEYLTLSVLRREQVSTSVGSHPQISFKSMPVSGSASATVFIRSAIVVAVVGMRALLFYGRLHCLALNFLITFIHLLPYVAYFLLFVYIIELRNTGTTV